MTRTLSTKLGDWSFSVTGYSTLIRVRRYQRATAAWTTQCARRAGNAYFEKDRLFRTGQLRDPGHPRHGSQSLRSLSPSRQSRACCSHTKCRMGTDVDGLTAVGRKTRKYVRHHSISQLPRGSSW